MKLNGVVIGYERPILPPFNLDICAGERLAILGPNGAGKSTLLKTMLGVLRPLAGSISYPAGRRPRVGYLPQSHQLDPAFPLSTHQVVLMGRFPSLGLGRRPNQSDHDAVSRWLALVGLAAQEQRPFRELSGGQRQRSLLARALVADPELLVLDEPTSAMDPAAEQHLLGLVSKLATEARASVLFVTHQVSAAAAFATAVVLINRHTGVVQSGAASVMLNSESLSQLYGLPIDLRRDEGRTLVWMARDAGEASA